MLDKEQEVQDENKVAPKKEAVEQQLEEPPEKEPAVTEIDIAAIGDLLIHSRVYNDAETEDGYNFMPMLEEVKPFLEKPTITIANQETMIGGAEMGLSTYPQFNSPYELADAIQEIGVDLVTIANNHTLDRGEEAVQNAINYYEEIGMEYTGGFKNEEDQDTIRVIETEENIDVAFLSYTYGTNGIPIPEGKDYLVNLIDRDKIKQDVEKAEEVADLTVVSYHFGNEYERLPSEEQKDLAQFSANLGVEVVIGHHPHVLQPIEWLQSENGEETLVVYSLGNFLSGQDAFFRRIGGMLQFSVEKTVEGSEESIRVHSPAFLPTFVDINITDQGMRDFEVLPLKDAPADVLPEADRHYEEIKTHMSQWEDNINWIE